MPNTKNFGYSTILTAPSPATSGTTLVVQSGDGTKFPATSFNATVWPSGALPISTNAEIVTVTNIATDTFTITRAQESSSARSIQVGDQIAATITAGLFPAGTIVGTSDSQVLTNKTLTAPLTTTITPTSGYTYDVGQSGTPFNSVWAGFSLNVQASGVNTEILAGANGVNKSLTLPLGTDTIVARNSTDTLTNKSMSEAQLTVTDITTNNATTSAHGFLPKLDNTATHFLDMTGSQRALAFADLPTGVAVQVVGTTSGGVATGTTTIPRDDTIPQNTEGDQYFTQNITPLATTNILIIDVTLQASYSVIADVICALFQDSTASAIAVSDARVEVNTGRTVLRLQYKMAAGTTSTTTFKVRAGSNTAGTFTLNGSGAARFFGGVMTSGIMITEYKA